MLKALEVAKYLLSLVDDEKGQIISNLALQKLLYYCQGYYLGSTGEKLFEEDIIAWRYGPVVPTVYEEYKRNECRALPTNELTNEIVNKMTKEQREIIETVFDYYKGYSAIGLMEKTHSETPWMTTRLNEILSTEKLINFFKDSVYE
jgi:uncharacterized phage-associated protein